MAEAMGSVEFIVPPIIPLLDRKAPWNGVAPWDDLPSGIYAERSWAPKIREVIAGEEFNFHPLFSAAFDARGYCQVSRDRLSGHLMIVDHNDRIIPRECADAVIEGITAFYQRRATPDEIEKANAEADGFSLVREVLEGCQYAKDSQPGIVYVVTGEHGFYKIGKTENLASRLRALSTASPYELEVVLEFRVNHMGRVEQALQKCFDHRRVRGEWFNLTEGDVADLKALHRLFNSTIPF